MINRIDYENLLKWFEELKLFVHHVLGEDDSVYIDECLSLLISHRSFGGMSSIYQYTEVFNWIHEYHKFKSCYMWYPHKLKNMLKAAVFIHIRDIDKAEDIITKHLYNSGYNVVSRVTNRSISIDMDFIKKVNIFFESWDKTPAYIVAPND